MSDSVVSIDVLIFVLTELFISQEKKNVISKNKEMYFTCKLDFIN